MTEDEFLEYISRYSQFGPKRPQRTKNGFLVHCPVHDDRTPSLHISWMENGMILHHCFAGCPISDVYPIAKKLMKELNLKQNTVPPPSHRSYKTRRKNDWIWAGEFTPQMLQGRSKPKLEVWTRLKEKNFLERISPSLGWINENGLTLPADKIWPYESPQNPGAFYCLVTRHTSPNNRKIIRPWALTKTSSATYGLRCFWPPAPRILYRAWKLLEYMQLHKARSKIIITEGEKSADAAQYLFPDCFATTWSGGNNSWHFTDFSCLWQYKPHIFFWPDHDAESLKSMQNISLLVGPRKARFPDFTDLLSQEAQTTHTQIRGWDAADALEKGWTPETVQEQRRNLQRGNSLKLPKNSQNSEEGT